MLIFKITQQYMYFVESKLHFTIETIVTLIVNSFFSLEHVPLVTYIFLHHDKYVLQDSTNRIVSAVWVSSKATITIALSKRKFNK